MTKIYGHCANSDLLVTVSIQNISAEIRDHLARPKSASLRLKWKKKNSKISIVLCQVLQRTLQYRVQNDEIYPLVDILPLAILYVAPH